jgi:hypothetical protein
MPRTVVIVEAGLAGTTAAARCPRPAWRRAGGAQCRARCARGFEISAVVTGVVHQHRYGRRRRLNETMLWRWGGDCILRSARPGTLSL